MLEELRTEPNFICEAVVGELAPIGVPAVPLLLCLLTDEDSGVRSYVVSALARIGDIRASTLLFNALRDEDIEVRISTLGYIPLLSLSEN